MDEFYIGLETGLFLSRSVEEIKTLDKEYLRVRLSTLVIASQIAKDGSFTQQRIKTYIEAIKQCIKE